MCVNFLLYLAIAEEPGGIGLTCRFLYWFFYLKNDTKFSLCSHWYLVDLAESTWFRPSFAILILATSLLIPSSVFADKNLDHIFLLIFQSICSRMCKIGFFFFHVYIFEKNCFFCVWNFNIHFLYISFNLVFQLCARCCVFTALQAPKTWRTFFCTKACRS